MASNLANVHTQAQARLRKVVSDALVALWSSLGSYRSADVPGFLTSAVPIAQAGQRQSVALTLAYITQIHNIPPFTVDMSQVTGQAVRKTGLSDTDAYSHPFWKVWKELGQGSNFTHALASGQSTLETTAFNDIQLSSLATFDASESEVEGFYGYRRVWDQVVSNCTLCPSFDGAYVKSANAIEHVHDNCGCSLEPLTAPHPHAKFLPDGTPIQDLPSNN